MRQIFANPSIQNGNTSTRTQRAQKPFSFASSTQWLSFQKCDGYPYARGLRSSNNLGWFYHKQKKYDKAEPLYKQALAVHEQCLVAHHQDTCIIRRNYITLLRKLGRMPEAEVLSKAVGKDANEYS